MKYTVVTALLALFLLVAGARPASATEVGYGRKFGLGFVLGDPTGLSGKYWVGPTNALDFALGFTNYGAGFGGLLPRQQRRGALPGLLRHQHQRRLPLAVEHRPQHGLQLDWYIGGGGRVVLFGGRGFNLGARMPLGLALMFTNPNFLEIFFEIDPAFSFTGGLTFEGGLGVRFYF